VSSEQTFIFLIWNESQTLADCTLGNIFLIIWKKGILVARYNFVKQCQLQTYLLLERFQSLSYIGVQNLDRNKGIVKRSFIDRSITSFPNLQVN
jgi:hypothetical protein